MRSISRRGLLRLLAGVAIGSRLPLTAGHAQGETAATVEPLTSSSPIFPATAPLPADQTATIASTGGDVAPAAISREHILREPASIMELPDLYRQMRDAELEMSGGATAETAAAALDLNNLSNTEVRVLLEFEPYATYSSVEISADGNYEIRSGQGTLISGDVAAETWVTITRSGDLLAYQLPGMNPDPGWTVPVRIMPYDPNALVRVRFPGAGARTYRGYVEVELGSTPVSVRPVNVLRSDRVPEPLEKYLYGVVTKEMPASYHMEAIKAQAVAARTFACSRYNGAYIRLWDTVRSQVYGGSNAENYTSKRATDETKGVIAVINGAPIDAFYSSTCGGHTENSESVFAYTASCRGVRCHHDRTPLTTLSNDAGALDFYRDEAKPSFCKWVDDGVDLDLYRWSGAWTRPELEGILHNALGFEGTLQALEVNSRGVAGMITRMTVRNTSGRAWALVGEGAVRATFSLRSANVAFERSADGNTYAYYGGGWGHGVGMCQNGAHGMATADYGYADILRHYYSAITLTKVRVLAVPQPTTSPGVLNFHPGMTVHFGWTATGREYHFEVLRSNLTLRHSSAWSDATSGSWTFGSDDQPGTYYWRVRARADGVETEFSEPVPFACTIHVQRWAFPHVAT